MRLKMAAAMFVLTVAVSVIPVAAHHSVSGTFDIGKELTIQGVVTKIEFNNPHTRFWVDVKNDAGAVSNWELELAPPNALKRTLGLDFIKVGDQVTVVLWQAKDGARLGNTLSLSVPDGRVFNFSRDTQNSWEILPTRK
jgi:hypothetical protein